MSAKRSFLLATFEGGGSVTPMIEVARKLVARGHRVRVMSDACNRAEGEAVGAEFVAWTRAPSKPERSHEHDVFDDWSQANPLDGFLNLAKHVLIGPAQAYAEDLIAELERERADLVLAIDMVFGAALGCEAIGQKHALIAVNIPVLPMAGFIPLGPGFAPPRTAEDHALHDAVRAGTEEMLATLLPGLNQARAALGLAPTARIGDQHEAAEVRLFATSRAFDFAPEELPAKIAYVGPLLGEPGWAEAWRSPFASGGTRPLALIAFSTTFQNHGGVVQNVIDAMADLPLDAVATLGGGICAEDLRPGDNVVILESAPHQEVMREAALVVTHGGHGTVMKALANGLPMLILPHGRDQDDNAVRVEERGAGIRLPRTASVLEIKAALERLLSDPSYGNAARKLGAEIARDAAESPLIAMLEEMAAPRRDASTPPVRGPMLAASV